MENNKPETVKLWARVGVTMHVSRAAYEDLLKGSSARMTNILTGKEGKVFLDGETYFPDIPENRALGEMEYTVFSDQPIGIAGATGKETPELKVFVESGMVNTILKSKGTDINVEVIDVDSDQLDYDLLRAYEAQVRADPSLEDCYYDIADFRDQVEELAPDTPAEPAVNNLPDAQDLPEHVTYTEVEAYLKRQGYPNPSQADIEDWFMLPDERQHQRDETVRNNYDLCDMDRWFHLEDILGVEMTYNAAMCIDGALWEEDIETLELNEPSEVFNTPDGVCKRRLLAALGQGELDPAVDNDCRLVTDEADLRRLALFFVDPQKAQDRAILDSFDRGRFTDTTNVMVCADIIDKVKVVCVDLCYDAKSEPCDVVNLTTLPATDENIRESKGFAFKLSNIHKIPWHSEIATDVLWPSEIDARQGSPCLNDMINSASERAGSMKKEPDTPSKPLER